MTQISLGSISPKDYSTPLTMENLGGCSHENMTGKEKS